MEDFKLHKLPYCGKVFVAFFCFMVMVAMVWMAIVGLMGSGLFEPGESELPAEETYEEETVPLDEVAEGIPDESVTPPEWEDSGQQEPIKPEDTGYFEPEVPEETQDMVLWGLIKRSSWLLGFENIKRSLEHLSTQSLLYLTVCFLFFLTTYSYKLKKVLFWLLGILIGLHVVGTVGYGFCWPANFLTYFCGSIIIVLFFIVSLMVLLNLRKK